MVERRCLGKVERIEVVAEERIDLEQLEVAFEVEHTTEAFVATSEVKHIVEDLEVVAGKHMVAEPSLVKLERPSQVELVT